MSSVRSSAWAKERYDRMVIPSLQKLYFAAAAAAGSTTSNSSSSRLTTVSFPLAISSRCSPSVGSSFAISCAYSFRRRLRDTLDHRKPLCDFGHYSANGVSLENPKLGARRAAGF